MEIPKTHDIITASSPKDGKLHILVDTEYTQSFHNFLKSNHVKCGSPSGAIWQSRRFYQDSQGRWRDEQECVVHAIEAEGTLEEFREWTSSWFAGLIKSSP